MGVRIGTRIAIRMGGRDAIGDGSVATSPTGMRAPNDARRKGTRPMDARGHEAAMAAITDRADSDIDTATRATDAANTASEAAQAATQGAGTYHQDATARAAAAIDHARHLRGGDAAAAHRRAAAAHHRAQQAHQRDAIRAAEQGDRGTAGEASEAEAAHRWAAALHMAAAREQETT